MIKIRSESRVLIYKIIRSNMFAGRKSTSLVGFPPVSLPSSMQIYLCVSSSNCLHLFCADRCQLHPGIHYMTSSITNGQFEFMTWLSCHWRTVVRWLPSQLPQYGGQITRRARKENRSTPIGWEEWWPWQLPIIRNFPREEEEVGETSAIWGLLPWRRWQGDKKR